ncbi:hypothetical protein [Gelidibacter sp.]|uniref:hypothetical protein n=1 Tax=Gelidibacter sp. TaxID=2018083 RepID=UPI002C1CED32|nr:hypothetical protein [Gelidibacter sp.]HUH26899.1 hypothetical protein [Gelidibacter sp.]
MIPAKVMCIKKKDVKAETFKMIDSRRPAAKKPFYKPWLATKIFVSSANLFDFNPKLLMSLSVSKIKK